MSLLMCVFTVHTVYSINNSFEKCPTDSAQYLNTISHLFEDLQCLKTILHMQYVTTKNKPLKVGVDTTVYCTVYCTVYMNKVLYTVLVCL